MGNGFLGGSAIVAETEEVIGDREVNLASYVIRLQRGKTRSWYLVHVRKPAESDTESGNVQRCQHS